MKKVLSFFHIEHFQFYKIYGLLQPGNLLKLHFLKFHWLIQGRYNIKQKKEILNKDTYLI